MNVVARTRDVPIGEVATINPKGPGSATLSQDELLDFLPMSDLSEDGTMAVSSQRPYSEVAKGYTAFRHGDVLLAKITPCFENNKIGLADIATEWAFGSTEFHVLRPGKDIDSRYLLHFLRQDAIRLAGEKRMTGSGGQRRVPKSFLEEMPIPLPPLAEQKRIAAILDQADALRRLRRRALDRLNTLGRAIFQEMFGAIHPEREKWPTLPFGDLAENLDGRRVPLKKEDREKIQGSFPYYGASGVIDYVGEHLFEGPHLLIGEDGANLLARSTPIAFIADGDFWVNNHAHVLKANGRAELQYLEFFIESIDLAPYVTGSAQPKLNQKQLNRIPVIVPPMNLQEKFVGALGTRARLLDSADRTHQRLDSLFSSLQHRAFTGQL